jgi:hypothetical protein
LSKMPLVLDHCNRAHIIYMGTSPMCTRNAVAAVVYTWIHPDVYPGMQLQCYNIWIHADVYPECNCSASIYMDTCRLCTWNAIAALV